MKEIIQELLRVENDAKRIVADAEAAARQALADARAQAQQRAEETRRRAAEDAQRLATDLADQARAQKQARLDETRSANRAAAIIPEPLAREAVDTICRAILGAAATPQARGES